MEIEKRFVAKIRNYHIIETKIIEDSKTVEVYYNIRSRDGRVVGARFATSKEPMELLLDIQKYQALENRELEKELSPDAS